MADFDKAWAITASWEGKWVTKHEQYRNKQGELVDVEEEYFGDVWWGTNHGLTGTYMREFTQWKATDKAVFQKMTRAQCGEIWKATRWTWNKCDQIENQEMANLIFDWSVRRMKSSVNAVRNALGFGDAINNKGSSLIGKGDAYSVIITNKSIGGNPANPNAGFAILTDLAIQELNARAKMPNTNFHALLKSLRKSKDKPTKKSVIDRYDSFFNQGTPTKDEWERMRDKGVPVNLRTKGVDLSQYSKKRGLIIENQPQLQDEDSDEDNTVRNLLLAFGVAKLFKIW